VLIHKQLLHFILKANIKLGKEILCFDSKI